MTAVDRLAGRGRELAAIDDFLTGVRSGTGQALALRGEPGAGKTALLLRAAERAAPARVLRATGAEPESQMAFAALHQLLRPVSGLVDALPEAQREAVRGALGLAAPTGGQDRFLVSAGVLSLLAEAAVPDGLVCIVDDFQWVDRASADALMFAARRLGADGVGLLFAARDTAEARHALKDVPGLTVAGLDAADAALVLAARSAVPPVPDVAALVAAATGGNPLALRETAGLLTPEQLTGRAPLPDPLPVGDGIGAVFGEQIARLPGPTRLVLLVAALEGLGDLRLVLRAAARLGAAADALDAAEAAGLLDVTPTGVRFRHPLIRSAVHAGAGAADRRAVHRALAAESEEAGDTGRGARHRAEAALGPDEDIAAELAAAAGLARARGGYADAARTLVRAADLTPDRRTRSLRLKDAAVAAWLGGRPGQARSSLAAARETAGDSGPSAEIAQLSGRFELHSGDAAEALRTFLTAAEQTSEQTPEQAARARLSILADAAEAASYVGDTDAAVLIGHRAEALPELSGPADAFLRDVLIGMGALQGGDSRGGARRLRRALDAVPDDGFDAVLLLWAAAAASLLGEGDVGARFAARAGRVARVSGMVGTLPVVLESTATAERMNSAFALSAALSEEGLALARETGITNSAAAHLANLAVCAAVRGDETDARARAHEALAIAIPHRLGLRVGVASYALGLLDLGLGRFEQAHERLTALTTAGPGAGHPAAVWGSTADRVEAAVGAGDLDAARASVDFLERWSANAASPRARALLARCRALVAEDGTAPELLRRSLDLLADDSGAAYDRARTALLLGERLRRERRVGEARPHLRHAAEAFGRLGAVPWERRALGELRAAGEAGDRAEPAALTTLTAQELRITRLVAEGLSNRDVAARLFLSTRTVEYHLYKVYPKLGVTSRTELARLLA
ncbi:helix-turn-helix transcriptional regulator [Streptomyces syringium]|uniref:DNA-binding CsgD family transcriptional regulator n=1 Tax=Streptomyces syringium TaxID=76729 RepID=A0ABS4YDR6_9ACTN|nr:LuxR family transcriptional regulator [Streptomyces syringium]MBP2406018.1 DNA-binding CsgD family transcriptional regulator [Streptomyces syringium]